MKITRDHFRGAVVGVAALSVTKMFYWHFQGFGMLAYALLCGLCMLVYLFSYAE